MVSFSRKTYKYKRLPKDDDADTSDDNSGECFGGEKLHDGSRVYKVRRDSIYVPTADIDVYTYIKPYLTSGQIEKLNKGEEHGVRINVVVDANRGQHYCLLRRACSGYTLTRFSMRLQEGQLIATNWCNGALHIFSFTRPYKYSPKENTI